MRKEHETELIKIEKVSTWLLWILYLAIFYILTRFVFYYFGIFSSPTSVGEPYFESIWHVYAKLGQINTGILTLQDKLVFVTWLSIRLLISIFWMYCTARLLQCFKKVDLFSLRNIGYARGIAYAYLAYVLMVVIPQLVRTFWYSDRWQEHLFIVVSELFSNFFIEHFLVLGLIWLFVWIYTTSTAIHLENEMTI